MTDKTVPAHAEPAMDPEHDLYGRHAELYDLIYDHKDYAAEAEGLHVLLQELGVADGARVLDAACGTGRHLEHLQRWYRVSGFDRSEAMLSQARARLSDAELFVADLCGASVAEPYDAVLCLFSAIGYVAPIERLRDAVRRLANAARPGGVVVIEPWLTPDQLVAGTPHMVTYESRDLRICRADVPVRSGAYSIHDFHWLVARTGRGVEHFTERHVLALYTKDQMITALSDAGLEAEHRDVGRGLYVARRPA